VTGIRRAASLLLAAACALPRPPSAPSPSAPSPGPASPSSRPEPRPDYGDDSPADRAPFEARALAEVLRSLRTAGGSAQPSEALHRTARELARADARRQPAPLSRTGLQNALATAAAFDPAPRVHLVAGSQDEALSALLARLRPDGVTHVGLGAVETDGVHHVALLLSRRPARIDRFPSTVETGAERRLSGELVGLLHPRVFLTRPDGSSTELDVSGGGPFASRVHFPAPGTYALEVVGTGRSGPEVAALLTVEAGAGGARAPRVLGVTEGEPAALEAAEALILEESNRLRRAQGLAALTLSPELTAVARRHSERMLDSGSVAHVLPDSPELADRLLSARIPFRRALENLARGESSLAAFAATAASPAHRSNLLAPSPTHVGVGLARGALPTGERIVYLTTILVEPPAAEGPDRLTPDARVREVLWSERARRKLPPLTNDLRLEGLARVAAAELRAQDGGDTAGLTEEALGLGRELAAADAFIASAPAEALRSRNVTDPRFRRVGVGVVVGDSRRFGPGRLYIAVVYSD
jgi:uncharacterized protein YkwD